MDLVNFKGHDSTIPRLMALDMPTDNAVKLIGVPVTGECGILHVMYHGSYNPPLPHSLHRNMIAMLTSLPVEILDVVAQYVGEDIAQLRQACRFINGICITVLWSKVTVGTCGVLQNRHFRFRMDRGGLFDLIRLYMDEIRYLCVQKMMDDPERCLKLTELLTLIWTKATRISTVSVTIYEAMPDADSSAPNYDWLHILTGVLQRCNPEISFSYCSEIGRDITDIRDFTDTQTIIQKMIRTKNVKMLELNLKIDGIDLDLSFFSIVGKYLRTIHFNATPTTITRFNEALKNCTSLEILGLYFSSDAGNRMAQKNFVHILPSSVTSMSVLSSPKYTHTIRGTGITMIRLEGDECSKVCGTMPNLKNLYINSLTGSDSEGIIWFKELVCHGLERVEIATIYAEAALNISGILHCPLIFSRLVVTDTKLIRSMVDLSSVCSNFTMVVLSIAPETARTSQLVWYHLASLLKKLPGVKRITLRTSISQDPEKSPLPGYTKKISNNLFEIDMTQATRVLSQTDFDAQSSQSIYAPDSRCNFKY